MNKTALTKTYTKDIQNFCLNSKKIVLSLAAISFSASCTHATLTPEIETYEEANRHAKARSGSRSKSSNNKTISSLQNSTQTVSGTGNTLVIESGGTITISNGGQQAVNFTQDSSTSTFLNQGTLIGGNNAASVNLGTNNQNGATIETFTNKVLLGNGSSQFGVTVWGILVINLLLIILVIVELFIQILVKVFILVTPIYQVLLIVGLLRVNKAQE
ncbi:hypothetical protein THJ097_08050 [Campylobacter jejuni]|nr:hypothetical protein THJ097_08050 [Campylobacter jejuni]